MCIQMYGVSSFLYAKMTYLIYNKVVQSVIDRTYY